MKIQYLGFLPAIVLMVWVIKDAFDDWEYSFLNMVILRFILIAGCILIIIAGLTWAFN